MIYFRENIHKSDSTETTPELFYGDLTGICEDFEKPLLFRILYHFHRRECLSHFFINASYSKSSSIVTGNFSALNGQLNQRFRKWQICRQNVESVILLNYGLLRYARKVGVGRGYAAAIVNDLPGRAWIPDSLPHCSNGDPPLLTIYPIRPSIVILTSIYFDSMSYNNLQFHDKCLKNPYLQWTVSLGVGWGISSKR